MLTLKQARRLAILVVGTTVGLLGLVMLVTPGPGIAVVVLGLAILAIEFAWAKRLLTDARSRVQGALRKRPGRADERPAASAPAEPPHAPRS
jgi:tellurite resistance protein TerC